MEQMSLQLYEGSSEGTLINVSGYANYVKVLSCFRLRVIDLQYFAGSKCRKLLKWKLCIHLQGGFCTMILQLVFQINRFTQDSAVHFEVLEMVLSYCI